MSVDNNVIDYDLLALLAVDNEVIDNNVAPTEIDEDSNYAETFPPTESRVDSDYAETIPDAEIVSAGDELADAIIGDVANIGDEVGAVADWRANLVRWRAVAADEGVTGLHFWQNRCPSLKDLYAECENDDRAIFNFGSDTDEYSQFRRGLDVIRARLDLGYFEQFKIGTTHCPMHRFANARYAYTLDGFNEFILICISDDGPTIARLETRLIAFYRRYDRDGLYVGPGHPLCCNHAPGGEGAGKGSAPWFVYLVLKCVA